MREYLTEVIKKSGSLILSGVKRWGKRHWAQTEMHQFPLKHEKKHVCYRDDHMLAQVVLGDARNLSRHGPRPADLITLL